MLYLTGGVLFIRTHQERLVKIVQPSDFEERTTKTLLEELRRGKKLVIVGWKASNHDDTTRYLEQMKVVDFLEEFPSSFSPQSHILITRFNRHPPFGPIERSGATITKQVLTLGVIRRLLQPIETITRKKHNGVRLQQTPTQPIETKQLAEIQSMEKSPDESRVSTPEPQRATLSPQAAFAHAMATVDRTILTFARDFAEETEHKLDGLVSRVRVAELVRKNFGENATVRSIPSNLLTAKSENGQKRVGWYQASSYLVELMTLPGIEDVGRAKSSPKTLTPHERAIQLIESEPDIRAEIARCHERIEELERNLTKIAEAREAVNKLNNLFAVQNNP